MKKKYNRPNISIFPSRCHISTLKAEVPEDLDRSRRSLLIKGGMLATVGHITLLHASGGDEGPFSTNTEKLW